MNDTELMYMYNGSEPAVFGLEPQEVLCAPPVTNQTWRMASGYIGAVLMLVMAVYGRYASAASVLKYNFCSSLIAYSATLR